jgi:putative heme degradation protein
VKIYNAIAIHDVYIVAETSEKAREALLVWIAEGEPPSEIVAVETNREVTIREAWREQKPLVAGDVSDADFKKLEGKTTIQVFGHIYTKRG